LTDGGSAYTLVQVSLNDLIILFLFAPIVRFLVNGASALHVPFQVLLVGIFPLAAGFAPVSIATLGAVRRAAAAPGALTGASNFFELAVAAAIGLFGPGSGAVLATVVGVFDRGSGDAFGVFRNKTRHWFPDTGAGMPV
jgi:ACR3 family arsenite transporter